MHTHIAGLIGRLALVVSLTEPECTKPLPDARLLLLRLRALLCVGLRLDQTPSTLLVARMEVARLGISEFTAQRNVQGSPVPLSKVWLVIMCQSMEGKTVRIISRLAWVASLP